MLWLLKKYLEDSRYQIILVVPISIRLIFSPALLKQFTIVAQTILIIAMNLQVFFDSNTLMISEALVYMETYKEILYKSNVNCSAYEQTLEFVLPLNIFYCSILDCI